MKLVGPARRGTILPLTLSDESIRVLQDDSFVSISDFLSPSMVDGLIEDVEILRESDEALVKFASAKHGNVEWFDLLPVHQPARAGGNVEERTALYQLVDNIQTVIEEMSGIKLDSDLTELKYAVYPSGGSYMRHLDGLNVGEKAREYSFVLYLNRDWTALDAGHLRVFEYEGGSINGYIDVEPKAGTIVVFKSDLVPHEVLPTSSKRIALVGWYNRRKTSEEVDLESNNTGEELSPLAAAILQHYRDKGVAVKLG
eukprot:CAMPEP_0194561752 /NCGR_PEP_ID=MMETSP0292-20121207/2425_1 /TAXON_ID=39354 /ORGANISM="Heterosigma akashiwo, Strain CCMP2393" /LENGTH=255 /DNA_ID=CAMNT_0039410231 /DNA_START=102 /DNA_END=869 /DNA_ORIENTATION=-